MTGYYPRGISLVRVHNVPHEAFLVIYGLIGKTETVNLI